jgi:phospholipid/cholesterol/gamma-HCH transport system permease protein
MAGMLKSLLHGLNFMGDHLIEMIKRSFYLASMLAEFLLLAFHRSTWTFPVRNRVARQLLFSGVYAVPFTILVAVIVGLSILVQITFWLRFSGNMELLAPILSAFVIREAAPVFTNLIVVGASASAMTTELANMKISKRIGLIEAQGINVFHFLVLPRMVGFSLSVLCLSILFGVVAFLSSAIGLWLLASSAADPILFFENILNAITWADLANLLAKGLLPGLLVSGICCFEGLSVSGAVTEVPKAVSRAILRSFSAVVIISTGVLFLTYLL